MRETPCPASYARTCLVTCSTVLVLLGTTACADEPTTADPSTSPSSPQADASAYDTSANDAIPIPASDGAEARPALCSHARQDAVRDVFCAPTLPAIGSLQDLRDVLGIELQPPSAGVQAALSGANVALLGHSTALSGRRISPINPRLIFMGPPALMAFQRGVQQVELIAADGPNGSLNLYLFRFEQACNQESEGCLPGDLYTPRVERDWLAWTIEDDEDLKNTPDDCRQCHQRALERPSLLMRELNNPWTHFFQQIVNTPNDTGPGVQGDDLMRDYITAKGSEPYGGFRLAGLVPIAPFLLESIVGEQPLLFDAPGIENERWPYDTEAGYPSEPGPSPTWEAAYAAFKQGEQLALPYLEPRATDPDKLARLSDAYARYRAGELSAEELPDLADIFPDDPLVRARIGLQTEPGADAVEVLIQACGPCHNDVLDQSISRARFNINLWGLDAAELDVAIERIERSSEAPGVMPPPEARQLDAEARGRLLSYLRQDPLEGEPEPRLVRAAELGMAGDTGRSSIERR